jgi:hypothetical protein
MDGTAILPRMIASGGQTGVDRAALDAAIHLGIPHGGWCPLGRLAEDGVVPPKYQLEELPSNKYWVRTERNVVDSDATLILFCNELSGGTQFTFRMTQKHHRPCLTVDLAAPVGPSEVRDWIHQSAAEGILNVAGPRESSWEGIHQTAYEYLVAVLS